MAFPIYLTGDNLGQRHRCLNNLVEQSSKSDVNFEEIKSIKEQSPIDRLFKIDLASKLRDVDYIIKNLKDNDMLYVSRALRSKWLLGNEHQNIINPEYLESDLYPRMITTAVSKMKCWVSVNLKDPDRCQQFYEYYFQRNFDLALRFLTHCHDTYILDQIPKILEKLDPFYLKVFSEKIPQVAKIFFDSLTTNNKVLNMYLKNNKEYYESLKVVLKADSNIYLDITEKYFSINEFNCLSSSATKFIMFNCKDRVTAKIELYAACLLDTKTMAEQSSPEECKEIVLKLARAKYLDYWFTYKTVEAFIKRLPEGERAEFKKKVFVKKDIGEGIRDWPYPKPSNPVEIKTTKVFDEDDKSYYSYTESICYDDDYCRSGRAECRMMMKCSAKMEYYSGHEMRKPRTVLDQLFDEYRFYSFEKTFIELRKKIAAESSPQNRQYMMLVLVSKSGGRADSVAALLQLLTKHVNEPPHVRATIVRSLVKRASVWRLPRESWESFLMFSTGLGLDGKEPDADCREGLHAVVLRNLLKKDSLSTGIISAYTKEFSTLNEYSLTPSELKIVSAQLPELLLTIITSETNASKQAEIFELYFKTINAYKLPINTSVVAPALSDLVKRDPDTAKSLVLGLYQYKKARRELFHENFMYISTDDSYLNALRHNIDVLKIDKYIQRVLEKNSHKEKFLRKLTVYFTEENGLAELYLSTIKQSALSDSNLKLARSLALLMTSKNLVIYLKEINQSSDKIVKRFAASLSANAHLAKPKLDIDTIEWNIIGPKAIANHVLICKDVDINQNLVNLLKSRRTLKLAIKLSQRTNAEVETFAAVGKLRPNVALKSAIKYFHNNPDTFKKPVWEIVKPIMRNYDFENKAKTHFCKILWKVKKIPLSIRADYCVILFTAAKSNKGKSAFILSQIDNLLPRFKDDFIEDILRQFLQNDFNFEQVLKYEDNKAKEICSYLKILVKFLLISTTSDKQSIRLERFGEPMLKTLKSVWESSENKDAFNKYFKEILNAFRYKVNFFNDNVSCLPVFERVVSWMHTILPMEIYFSTYADLHLTMIYYKAIKICFKQNPDVFKDETKKCKEGITILGRVFGQLIAKEVDELKARYFESILELYGRVMDNYLNVFFFWDPMKDEIFSSIIKGIAEYGTNTTPLLGVYILKNRMKSDISNELYKDLEHILRGKDNKEINFFLDF